MRRVGDLLCNSTELITAACVLQVVDEGKGRAVQVEKEGFPDAVVWNPWIKKAAGMADFGDEEYKA